ncbi:ribonuclease H family protein [Gangjinia marincola]|uniref:Ribonuclease H n=1 Tax=Gangjinia marincola TaxID=578463 RepID=A0ABP3XTQ9_9FLAO
MAKKQKYYVVWKGKKTGVFSSWKECKIAIEGFKGAEYKSFLTKAEAEKAYKGRYADYKGKSVTKKQLSPAALAEIGQPNLNSISVDAASSGNPGKMEYRGVDTSSKKELFKQGPFAQGTNNIGEFLALVHGLAFLKKHHSARIIYTDSRTAMSWVRQKKCMTKLAPSSKNSALFELVKRAEDWLKTNSYTTSIIKWETKAWGEIPADFGRK